jgi:hypothetical protein
MRTASISIHGVRDSYRPGETLRGSIEWSAQCPLDRMEIRLFWMTGGLAPRQIGRVETRSLDRLPAVGSEKFEFVLPTAPWSFQGRLVHLDWVVEVLFPPGDNAHVVFSLLPEGHRRLLYSDEQFE